jgi:MerR family Zn(II)-responsive transcriptional regulator of zntA
LTNLAANVKVDWMARYKAEKKNVMQIGDLARKAGLSVRAIRYYEELGLIQPEAHSLGGFRLYGHENFKRLQVINFLKEVGLSLDEIRQILLAKKASGADRETVQFLVKVFGEKLELVEAKIRSLNAMKAELTKALSILRSCECCDHKVLLDAICCGECANLEPRDTVPDTFEVILQ